MERLKVYFILFILTSSFGSCKKELSTELPIFSPSDFNPELVDKSLHNSTEKHFVAEFELLNQNGDTITQKDYNNKIYIVDFFFTTCPSICPIMTDNMLRLQEIYLANSDIMLLSMSVTPIIDSVPVLHQYALDKGVIDSKWNLTTGDKKHIYELARKSYFAVVEEGDGGVQDFIHTPNFILVDKQKQIRGIYDGIDDTEILRLIRDVRTLSHDSISVTM